ncbi:MAG: biosynthetic-type acetolactate synthase large subunit [Sphaerochaetaceae bacterium]|nr:biosynthetic-type acetolactate synthase large subunit [Sphaerochaetaceae bacterium]
MKLSGAEIIVACLKEQKVDTIFGFPGGAVLHIYDALYKHRHEVNHILTSHEQGAAHAADGYARTTGKVGVVFATSGPGATNLVTGLATAYMDSVPVVAFTGNVPTNLLGKDSFQEVDIAGITMPITKHNYIVKDVNDLAPVIREAFEIARSDRPGPVLIDIPKDVTAHETEYTQVEIDTTPKTVNRYSEKDIDKIVKMLKEAKRPMAYIGGGAIISKAQEEVKTFLDTYDIAAGVSLMAYGVIDQDNERFTGMIGMHGSKVSNLAVSHCDLLIVIGARFSDRVVSKESEFAKKAKILQIDIDPAEINKNIITHHNVIGNIKDILAQLNDRVSSPVSHSEWMKEVAQLKIDHPIRVSGEAKRPYEVLKALSNVAPENTAIVTEVGQHQMWAAQYYRHTPKGKFLTSGGLGTMGYGTGASMGAQFGAPERRVVNVAGDGSFKMNCNELATISRYGIPVIILVMNNHTLGMVRQWQTFFYDNRYAETTLDTEIDWVKLAEAYGVKGMRLNKDDDPAEVLKAAFDLKAPVVIDCEIGIDDKVFPMVAPGASIEVMIDDEVE